MQNQLNIKNIHMKCMQEKVKILKDRWEKKLSSRVIESS